MTGTPRSEGDPQRSGRKESESSRKADWYGSGTGHDMKIVNGMILVAAVGAVVNTAVAGEANTLTAQEKKEGWQLLFDGKSTENFRRYGQDKFPAKGWKVADGWLNKIEGERGGNVITRKTYTDFEFKWEWRMAEGGNNGVKYFVDEKRGELGHEYQMLASPDRKLNKGSTAGFYAVLSPKKYKPVKVAPGINQSRILVQGDQVKHWLNGELVLEYTCGSEEVLANVATSKFKKVKDFGKKVTAHIMLTDHNSGCSFRNLKIRALPAK